MDSQDRPAFVCAWRGYLRAHAAIHRVVGRELREYGLSGAQLAILRVLSEAGESGVKLNEISHRLAVTSGNVTGLIDRLEEAGHLVRHAHPEDRRVTLAVLTPAGREVFERVQPAHLGRVERVMSSLTPQEQLLLADLLDRIAEHACLEDERR
ncbi:MAG: MarR family transcriptional regulator [Armatimonadota bacterium]|jgi:MarR family 2-MHQ and catechol resistance regulon transcriptional repressor